MGSVCLGSWTILSIMMLVVALQRQTVLHGKMMETKDHLLLLKTNWDTFDERAQRILTCMVSRLKDVGYGPKILGSVSVTTALFNLTMLVVPFGVDVVYWLRGRQ
ncbi:hypothetical protein AAVH_07363 [Aphelenchoides avenae]|nr:hypothetical protein AAVH_07363 [Aphelenchus avenae]